MWGIPYYAGLKSNNLKKLNGHSFFENPFYYWLSWHHQKFLVLFTQDLIDNCFNEFVDLSWVERLIFVNSCLGIEVASKSTALSGSHIQASGFAGGMVTISMGCWGPTPFRHSAMPFRMMPAIGGAHAPARPEPSPWKGKNRIIHLPPHNPEGHYLFPSAIPSPGL